MLMTYKQQLIEVLECRIKAQQPEIDALKRNPDNNRFVNYLEVATERRKETVAILVECIGREADEIKTAAALEYYADKRNYISDVMPIECDEGKRARDALKLIKR